MRLFVIDTDTASDDAVALVMAFALLNVRVVSITTVAGNVALEQATQNARYTVELCAPSTPVYAGSKRPLLRPLFTALHIHGQDGLSAIGLPVSGRQPSDGFAPYRLVELINDYPDELTLVTLGPLTMLALALLQDASMARKVKQCVMMGGIGSGLGNITPVAEYNIYVDPEAARIVFESGLPITMVGWDVSRTYAYLTAEESQAMHQIGTPIAHFYIAIQKTLLQFALHTTQLPGFDLPAPPAMAIALDPTLATDIQPRFVQIKTLSDLCRGQTVVDHLGVTKRPPNAQVVLAADRTRFRQILSDALRTHLD